MCNRTDCAGDWAGELACRVCREGNVMTEAQLSRLDELVLSHELPQIVGDLVYEIRSLRAKVAELERAEDDLK